MAVDWARGAGEAALLPAPPELPRRFVRLEPTLGIGTLAWFVAFCVLLAVGGTSPWLWASLAGWILGLTGFLIVAWQRAASRRGARGAQRDL